MLNGLTADLSWLGQPSGPERNHLHHHHHLAMGVQAGVHTLGQKSCQGGATNFFCEDELFCALLAYFVLSFFHAARFLPSLII